MIHTSFNETDCNTSLLSVDKENSQNFFLSPLWLNSLKKNSPNPLSIAELSDGNSKVGVALLGNSSRQCLGLKVQKLHLNESGFDSLDPILIEYNGVRCEPSRQTELLRALLNSLLNRAKLPRELRNWSEFSLGGVSKPLVDLLEKEFVDLRFVLRSEANAYSVDLDKFKDSGFDGYLASISSNSRQQVRRSIRAYQALGPLRIDAAQTLDQAHASFDKLIDLHQKYWVAKNLPGAFGHRLVEPFHRDLIQSGFETGNIEMLSISAGDTSLGYFYNFIQNGWVGAYMSGLSYRQETELRPGLVGYALMISEHIKNASHCFDFMSGNHRYKLSLGTKHDELRWVDVQRKTLLLNAEAFGRRMKAKYAKREVKKGD
jgi:Acetyltransferase (GNAT) domain